MTTDSTLLELRKIRKTFPGLIALNNVDFDLRSGEIHALLGENGAGKSTLIKVMTGAYSRDSGDIFLKNKASQARSPAEAQALGISTVYQEVNLCPNLSVAHNLFLGREEKKFGCVNWKKINQDAQTLLARFKIDIDVTKALSTYSIAIQQLIAIARGIDRSASVLILDEPTASLDADEVNTLFGILQQLKSEGLGIIFVTHFLEQVYQVTDRITVLRNGQKVGTFETKNLPRAELIGHMLGKELQAAAAHRATRVDSRETECVIKVEDLHAPGKIEHASFEVKKGEALGLAGLLGSGRTEICEIIFGVNTRISGRISIQGKTLKPGKPANAVSRGIALCPEDRKAQGIIGPLSIRENIILALQALKGWWKPIPRAEQNALALRAIDELNIATTDMEKPLENLSGGNQQKVILGRWLATKPQLLVLDEPTRGIDIGAHAEIIKLIRSLCEQGMALVVASSELEELVAFSDTVLVMRDHKKVAELCNEDITEDNIMSAIASA